MRRADARMTFACAFALSLALAGCVRTVVREVRVGPHLVRLQTPAGWQRFDHGRQQLFRRGEAQVSLEDVGPLGPEGIQRELESARRLWREGREKDAFARVTSLHVPEICFDSAEQRQAFWQPWSAVLADPARGNAAVERAFDGMLENTRALGPVRLEDLAAYALKWSEDESRRAVAHRERRHIGKRPCVVLDTWDRVTHGARGRTAFIENGGYLLQLKTDRGTLEQTAAPFESLLGSLEVLPNDWTRP